MIHDLIWWRVPKDSLENRNHAKLKSSIQRAVRIIMMKYIIVILSHELTTFRYHFFEEQKQTDIDKWLYIFHLIKIRIPLIRKITWVINSSYDMITGIQESVYPDQILFLLCIINVWLCVETYPYHIMKYYETTHELLLQDSCAINQRDIQ